MCQNCLATLYAHLVREYYDLIAVLAQFLQCFRNTVEQKHPVLGVDRELFAALGSHQGVVHVKGSDFVLAYEST